MAYPYPPAPGASPPHNPYLSAPYPATGVPPPVGFPAPAPPGYGAPGYGAPVPPLGYGAPAPPPGYGAPAPPPGYGAPAPPPGYGAPAPAPVTVQPTVVQTSPSVVIMAGNTCPACRSGVLSSEFTCCGICLGICFFPLGMICCFTMRERRCSNCRVAYK